jgi:hypothetical protein
VVVHCAIGAELTPASTGVANHAVEAIGVVTTANFACVRRGTGRSAALAALSTGTHMVASSEYVCPIGAFAVDAGVHALGVLRAGLAVLEQAGPVDALLGGAAGVNGAAGSTG